MLSAASQIQFAAEFLGLLVAASGVALVALRPDLTARRGWFVLAAGFALAGAVAFAHGSLLVTGPRADLAAGRLGGGALVAAGGAGWRGGRSRTTLWCGAALLAAGAAAEWAGATPAWTDGLLVAGNLALAGALLAAARRSIAARVAVNAAATLLAVVLVLSVALSSVIADAVRRDRLLSLDALARIDTGQVAAGADSALAAATSVTAGLAQGFPTTAPPAADRRRVLRHLEALAAGYRGDILAYRPPGAPAYGTGAPPLLAAVAADPVLGAASCTGGVATGRSVIRVVGSRLVAAAADPVCRQGRAGGDGAVLVVVPIDRRFLARLRSAQAGVGITLASGGRALASVGLRPPPAVVAAARPDQRPADRGGLYVAVASIRPSGGSDVLVVLASSTAGVASTQASLFRTLFVIALGGTLLALGLAAFTGDRVTAGVRRLTVVAQRIQRTGVSERAGVVAGDEVGTLATAFDAMVASVDAQSVALRAAADAEARLRGRIEAIVAGMGEALVAVDSEGVVTDFNRAAAELTGVGSADAVGRPAAEVLALEGGAAAGDATGGGVRGLRRPDGVTVPVAVSTGALRGGAGEPAGTVLVLRDLRREQEVERMKSEFLSRVGHELRTPLTGILGYADILLRRDVPAERAREWHAEIVASAKRQLRIIQLLEFFASSGAGRLALRTEAVDVAGLVDAVVAGWDGRAGADHPITVQAVPGLPRAAVDPRWLSLAVDELIDNAVKFSPGGGRIAVRVAPASGVAAIEISVRDHGRGMSAAERRSAFADFAQGDSSDTRVFGGLGLGLPFVQRVVDAHGGRVTCRSAPGRGTLLSIGVPVGADGGA